MGDNTKVVYEGRALTLALEQAIYPDGSKETLEIIHHPGGAACVAINQSNEVCLIRQFRYAAGGWIWEVPAGRIESKEDPIETVRRELKEEAGVTAMDWKSLGTIFPSPGICDERIFLYMAMDLSLSNTSHEETEFIEIHWIPFSDAIDWIKQGEIVDAKTITALFSVQARLFSHEK